jgi:tetratricopeptide (TPR) repeat protein
VLDAPINLGFEDGERDGIPTGWFRCGHDGYELSADHDEAYAGRASGRVRSVREPAEHEFGGLGQQVSAEDFRAGRIRLVGWLRTETVAGNGAGLWMRIDGPDGTMLDFDNMQQPLDRALTGTTEWTRYEIVLDVPPEAIAIAFGILISGRGTVWGDNLRLERVDDEAAPPDGDADGLPARRSTVPHPPIPFEIRFYSRDDEQESFRRLLHGVATAGNDKTWSPVLVLYGIGGIGKSTLLNRLRESGGRKTTTVLVDWALVRQLRPAAFPAGRGPSFVTVLDELRAEACRDERLARHFKAYGKLRDRLDSIAVRAASLLVEPDGEEVTDGPLRVTGAITEATGALTQVAETMAALPPGAGVVVSALGSVLSAVAESTTAWGRLRRRLKPDDFRALRDAESDLAAAIAGALRAASGRRPTLLFLDTYEIVQGSGAWLRRIMRESGPRVGWILSGRFAPDHEADTSELRQFATAVPDASVHELQPFDEGVLASVLAQAAPDRRPDERDLAHLMRATKGIPLAIRLVADLWRGGVPLAAIAGDEVPGRSIAEVQAEQFLVHLRATGSDLDLMRILTLALLRDADDADLLAALWGCRDVTREFDALARRYDFVLARGHRLHDTIQDFLARYLLDPFQRRQVRDANRRAVALLERRLRTRHEHLPTLARRLGDEAWVSDTLALAWHRYWVDAAEGWQTLRSVLPAAIVYAPSTGQAFLDIADHFARGRPGAERDRSARLREMLGRTAAQQGSRARRAVADLARPGGRPGYPPDAGCEAEQAVLLAVLRGRSVADTEGTADAVREIVAAAEAMPPAAANLGPAVAKALVPLLRATLVEQDQALAVRAAEVAARLEPQNPQTHRRRISVLHLAQRPQDALAAAESLARLSPESWEAHQMLGELRWECADFPGALAAFREAERIDPGRSITSEGIAVVLCQLGHPPDEVLAPLDAAVERAPDSIDLRRRRAELLLRFGRDAEAVADLDVLLERAPDDVAPHEDRLGALMRLDRGAEALRAIGRLLTVNPEDASAPYDLNTVLYWRPHSADLTDALRDVLDSTAGLPDTVPVLHVRGRANLELDRPADAETCLVRLIELDATNFSAHLDLAIALQALDRMAEALAACERATGIDATDPVPFIYRADILLDCGEMAAAESAALRATERGPTREIDGWVLAGVLAWHDGRLGGARQRLQRAVETDTALAETMRPVRLAELRSIALLALGHRDAAFAELHRAVAEIPPEDRGSELPEAYRMLLAHWRDAPDGLWALRSLVDPARTP